MGKYTGRTFCYWVFVLLGVVACQGTPTPTPTIEPTVTMLAAAATPTLPLTPSPQPTTPTFTPTTTPPATPTNTPIPIAYVTIFPFPTVTPPAIYQAKQIFMQFGSFGGDGVPPFRNYYGSNTPELIIYTDGQTVLRQDNEDEEGYSFWETTLSSEEMCHLLGQINNSGFFNPLDEIYAFDETTEYSDGASNFVIQVNGPLTKTVSIYSKHTGYLVDPIDVVYDLFANYQPVTPVQPYTPQQLLLWITPPFNEENLILSEWPAELPALTEIWHARTEPQLLIEGELIAPIQNVFSGQITAKNFLIGDEVYSVVMRPLLPHETPANFSIYPHEPTSFNLPFACTNLPALISASTLVPTTTPTLVAESQTLRGRIVFSSTRDGNAEIYVMYADGTQLIRLTNHPGNDTEPVWSPDGQRIAFVSDRSGHNEIYVMNADGTNVTRLTFGPSDKTSPAWSPNGQNLVFVDLRNESYEIRDSGIYLINSDGSNLTSVPVGGTDEFDPIWSRYGGYLIYQTGVELRIATIDGSEIKTLGHGSQPALSPNGLQLAYVMADLGNGRIVTAPLTETFARLRDSVDLTPDSPNDYAPAWSPDGQRIVFVSERDGNAELYVMNADGSNPIRLTYTAAAESDPDWTP